MGHGLATQSLLTGLAPARRHVRRHLIVASANHLPPPQVVVAQPALTVGQVGTAAQSDGLPTAIPTDPV